MLHRKCRRRLLATQNYRGRRLPSCLSVLLLPLLAFFASAQIKPPIGIRQNTPNVHALINTRIITSPGRVIEKGIVVFRDGIITSVGENTSIPPDARIWDMSGRTMYAGFIDSYSDIGMPRKLQPGQAQDQGQQPKNTEQMRGPKHWNGNVQSGIHAVDIFVPDLKAAEKLRSVGFTTALAVPQKGIFRGSSALVNLGDGTAKQMLVKADG